MHFCTQVKYCNVAKILQNIVRANATLNLLTRAITNSLIEKYDGDIRFFIQIFPTRMSCKCTKFQIRCNVLLLHISYVDAKACKV